MLWFYLMRRFPHEVSENSRWHYWNLVKVKAGQRENNHLDERIPRQTSISVTHYIPCASSQHKCCLRFYGNQVCIPKLVERERERGGISWWIYYINDITEISDSLISRRTYICNDNQKPIVSWLETCRPDLDRLHVCVCWHKKGVITVSVSYRGKSNYSTLCLR